MKVFLELIKLLVRLIGGVKVKKDSSVIDAKEVPEIRPVKFKNESSRLEREYATLKENNLDLYLIIEHLNERFQVDLGTDLVITMIYRTQEEQDDIYIGKTRNGIPYITKPWKSPHQYYHAVDIRSRELTKEEIKSAVDALNAEYNSDNYYKFTALCHDVGLGDHFHINFIKGK